MVVVVLCHLSIGGKRYHRLLEIRMPRPILAREILTPTRGGEVGAWLCTAVELLVGARRWRSVRSFVFLNEINVVENRKHDYLPAYLRRNHF